MPRIKTTAETRLHDATFLSVLIKMQYAYDNMKYEITATIFERWMPENQFKVSLADMRSYQKRKNKAGPW